MVQNLRCNEQIRISPVRLIDDQNNQLGVVETNEALRRAREANLDLVEVAPKERPPVCRIMDYGKWKYSQKKKHKKHHEQQLKQVRIRPKTDDFDREIKVNRAIRFLKKGDKVQFTMVFRGRERAHRDLGVSILSAIARKLGELVKLERPPSMDGRNMIMIVSPIKAALDKYEAPEHLDEGADDDEGDENGDDGDVQSAGETRRGGLTVKSAEGVAGPSGAAAPSGEGGSSAQSAPGGPAAPPGAAGGSESGPSATASPEPEDEQRGASMDAATSESGKA